MKIHTTLPWNAFLVLTVILIFGATVFYRPRTYGIDILGVCAILVALISSTVLARKLKEADVKLDAIDKAKTEFVLLASHQLRTPLSTMSWYIEMLLSGDVGKLDKEQKKYLDEIYTSNRRMVALVNALLHVSRLELGAFATDPAPTNIIDIAKTVIREIRLMIEKKEITLKEQYAADFLQINTDSKLIRIILQNLISNAVRYTPKKGKVTIEISLSDDKAHAPKILISVSDTGYGIPKGQQRQVFTKLFRADNVKEKDVEGTGLGLYIVKSIVEQLGGAIRFESEENKGTTFYVTLPAGEMKKVKM